jgi:hypothetical protein
MCVSVEGGSVHRRSAEWTFCPAVGPTQLFTSRHCGKTAEV